MILGKDRVRRAEGRSQSEVSFEEEVKTGFNDTFEKFLLRTVRKGGRGWRGAGGQEMFVFHSCKTVCLPGPVCGGSSATPRSRVWEAYSAISERPGRQHGVQVGAC